MADVVDFASRRIKALETRHAAEEDRAAADFKVQRDLMLEMVDKVRVLIEEGKIEGLILLGRDPATKYFHSQVCLMEPAVERHDLFAYAGYLDTIRLELIDHATMAPFMTPEGLIEDPYEEPEE